MSESVTERFERFWFASVPAEPWILLRSLYGLTVFAWTLTLIPDMGRIYGDTGLAAGVEFERFRVISLFRWLPIDALGWPALIALLGSALALVAGRRVRVTAPLTAFLFMSFADAQAPWLIGAELVLMLFGLWIALFSALTPEAHQGARRDPDGSRGSMPAWGLRLVQTQIVLAYLTTGYEKLLGDDWTDGSAVFHAIASETRQRVDPPSFLLDNSAVIASMTWTTLAVELLLGPLLLWPRTRRAAVVLALALHLAFQAFLVLGFFAPAMAVGILSFLPAADARRVLEWRPWNGGRTAPGDLAVDRGR